MIFRPVTKEDGLLFQFAKETFALPIIHVIPGVNPGPIYLARLVVLDQAVIAATARVQRVIVRVFSSDT